MPFTEDLSVFFQASEFASQAIWTDSDGDEHAINGILDMSYAEPLGEYESIKPAFICAESDVKTAEHGDQLQVDQDIYRIIGVKPDGTGVTALYLEYRSTSDE